jgi:hypothetical protein
MHVHREEQLGSLIAGLGLVYTVYMGTQRLTSLSGFSLPPGPLEACATGVLVWLHAKWRRVTSMNR